mgnify:CR=1 FL=1
MSWAIICVQHRYIDQMGTTPCPSCEPDPQTADETDSEE